MNEYRQLAAKIDRHMRQLALERVHDGPTIMLRMMPYAPDLHTIWTGTSDRELMALCDEFEGFHHYASLIEEASVAERAKPSRPYDGLTEFSEPNKQRMTQLLKTAASLESGYQALRGKRSSSGADAIDKQLCQWLADVNAFKSSLRAEAVEAKALGYVDRAFDEMAKRIQKLADRTPATPEQIEIARSIDARMQALARQGIREKLDILREMYDAMPGFKRLLDTASHEVFNELGERFGGFHRYAKVLEWLAQKTKSGEIVAPK